MTSVIIPAFGQKHHTIKCLETLEGVDQIIVVDDSNGFAVTVNKGLSIADGDYLIICNNDIEFIQENWLEHLLKPLKDGYGVSSIRTSDSDGWDVVDKIEENVKFGSLWAMTRGVYEKVGKLDERFGKGYYEDLDYWRRVQDAGFKIAKNHNGLVHHVGKATFDVIDPNDKLYERNMFLYKQKWGDKAYLFETAPNSVLLVDDYEITDEQREIAKRRGISLEEAERRWGKVL